MTTKEIEVKIGSDIKTIEMIDKIEDLIKDTMIIEENKEVQVKLVRDQMILKENMMIEEETIIGIDKIEIIIERIEDITEKEAEIMMIKENTDVGKEEIKITMIIVTTTTIEDVMMITEITNTIEETEKEQETEMMNTREIEEEMRTEI